MQLLLWKVLSLLIIAGGKGDKKETNYTEASFFRSSTNNHSAPTFILFLVDAWKC